MITITHDTTIERPIDEVFAFMSDACNDSRWCPPVLEVKQVGGNGPAAGTCYRLVAKPGPFKTEGTFEIIDYVIDSRVEFKGTNDVGDFHYWYTFEPVNGATRVEMTSKLDLKGWKRILRPIIRHASGQTAVEEFKNLKQLLEKEC